MLKTMRKFRRSVLGVVIVAVIAMTMSGFGVDFALNSSRPYAIKVGDREISFEQYSKVRRSIEARYRQMFGANTDEFLKSLGINTAQQAVDASIDAELLLQLSEELGLEASDKSVQEMLVKDLFQGQFDKQRYASFLSAQGISAKEFENDLKKDVVRRQISNLFQDTSKPSIKEAKAQLKRDKTAYSFNIAKLNSSDLVSKVSEPENSEIEKYYDQNLSDFQLPAKVSYKAISISPEDYAAKVEISEDDIEMEYSDNMSSYKTEPQIRYSQIVLKLSASSSETQKGDVRKKSMELLQKIKDGTKFEDLARSSSQDIGSALKAGDAGWINKSQVPDELADKIAKLEIGALSDPIETTTAIYLIRLDDKKEPQQKELAEVRDEIIKKLKNREAPAILALDAEQIFEKWSSDQQSIEDLAKEKSLPQVIEARDFEATKDLSPALEGLTAKVLANAGNKKQLIESGSKQVFVQIENFSEETIQPLDNVRAGIVQKLKLEKARVLAREKAQSAKNELLNLDAKGFVEKAKSLALQTEELLDLNRSSAKGAVAEAQIRDKVFAVSKSPLVFDQVFESADSFIIAQVSNIKEPAAEEIEKSLESAIKDLARENEEMAIESYLTKAKAQVKIDIQPSLLNN